MSPSADRADGLREVGGQVRCWWCGDDPIYCAYHDDEWGRPVADDRRIFEKLCLEGFQSGLSWRTILHKRAGFRAAFDHFEIDVVASYDAARIDALVEDERIVRNRRKIESVVNNARRARELQAEVGSLAAFVWSFEPAPSERPTQMTRSAMVSLASTAASTHLARALKRRGWTWVGPTTMYAAMQSLGLVNDHLEGCDTRAEVARARQHFTPPELAA